MPSGVGFYDGFNRLVKTDVSNAGKTTTSAYTYNGDGLRVSRTVTGTDNQGNPQTRTANYLYSGQYVIAETGTSTAQYVRGLSYIAKIGAVSGISFYQYNAHGDVVRLVDNSGNVQNRYDYDVFGNSIDIYESVENSIRYAGEFYDSEAGLYYLRARYYDPVVGRFVTEDSFRGFADNPASLNLYTYCWNDPIRYRDPTGHTPEGDESEGEWNFKAQHDIRVKNYLAHMGLDFTNYLPHVTNIMDHIVMKKSDGGGGGGPAPNPGPKPPSSGNDISDEALYKLLQGKSMQQILDILKNLGLSLSRVRKLLYLSDGVEREFNLYSQNDGSDYMLLKDAQNLLGNSGTIKIENGAVKLHMEGKTYDLGKAYEKEFVGFDALLETVASSSNGSIDIEYGEYFAGSGKGKDKGQVIFLTHGLADSAGCFQQTIKNLKLITSEKYISLGVITTGRGSDSSQYYTGSDRPGIYYNDEVREKMIQEYGEDAGKNPDKYVSRIIDYYTERGYNVLIRTEFSQGNLSFEFQKIEMGVMVGKFEGHKADVTFIGHSMGGLASINYGMRYATLHPTKQVTVITVDTPYHKNTYAAAVWDNAIGFIGAIAGQKRGLAHRDLGGYSDALEKLKNSWNSYKGTNIELYAINVSMYSKNLEPNWSSKGDGIVSIPSQQGVGWNRVNVQATIFGTGQGKPLSLEDAANTDHLYHHTNTPKRMEVATQINKLIK